MRLYQGRHSVAGIPLGLAGEAPQEGLQEEEVEHGALRTALPQAPVDANASCGAMCGDDVHQGSATEDVQEPDQLPRDPHVAYEKRQRSMQSCVECLGDVKGQDMILLLSTLQPALVQEHRGRRRGTPCVLGRPGTFS